MPKVARGQLQCQLVIYSLQNHLISFKGSSTHDANGRLRGRIHWALRKTLQERWVSHGSIWWVSASFASLLLAIAGVWVYFTSLENQVQRIIIPLCSPLVSVKRPFCSPGSARESTWHAANSTLGCGLCQWLMATPY